MSTPYRIEYKGIVSIAGGSDGYPRDVIQEEIIQDLPTIKNNPKEYIADIALEGQDYYGRRIDNIGVCPAEYEYIVEITPDDTLITVSGYDGKRATISLNSLNEMSESDVDDLYEYLKDGFEDCDQSAVQYFEALNHKIYQKESV